MEEQIVVMKALVERLKHGKHDQSTHGRKRGGGGGGGGGGATAAPKQSATPAAGANINRFNEVMQQQAQALQNQERKIYNTEFDIRRARDVIAVQNGRLKRGEMTNQQHSEYVTKLQDGIKRNKRILAEQKQVAEDIKAETIRLRKYYSVE